MKKIIVAIILSFSLTNNTYAAGDSAASAVVSMALVGAIYSINSAQYDEWLKSEMESWKYDETNLTSSLSRACDINLELRLHRNRRTSYIIFVIHNQKKEAITLNADNIDVAFPNGAVRKFKSIQAVSDYKVDPGWTVQGVFPLSEKTELAKTQSLELRLPFIDSDGKTRCDLKGTLHRNVNRTPDYLDYNRLLTAEFSFFYGNNLLGSSSLKNTSEKEGLFGLMFSAYVYKNYGFTVGFIRQDLKQTNNSVVQTAKSISGEFKLSESNFLFGFSANYLYGRKYSLSYSLGFLGYNLENSKNLNSKELETKTGQYANVDFNYIYFSSDSRPFIGDYMVGVGFLLRNIPKFTISTAEFGGLSLAPHVNFNIGF